MDFCPGTSPFAGALEQIEGVVGRKRMIPIVAHALIEG
jgi:DNA polymerase III sliding clamp (beta) subunit (PCNA family)